jgi:type IV pilus assembly protein PilV
MSLRFAPSRQRGYTIVELLMAVSLFAIGVTGVIAMQKVTVAANQHAKRLAIATHIAQAWQEQLVADSVGWNHPSPNNGADDIATDTVWLKEVGNGGVWFRPSFDANRAFGPAFDALGNVVPPAELAQAQYCTHVRLTWLYPATNGNGLMRAEVRVFWVREGLGGAIGGLNVCDPNTAVGAVETSGERYHFVYHTNAVKQNTAL